MSAKIHHQIGPKDSKIRILYINPNSTLAFTQETIEYLESTSRIPNEVLIDFYTPPSHAAPPSIDGTLDGVISTAGILKDLGLINESTGRADDIKVKEFSETYSSIIVSCFSSHPLVPSLKEIYSASGLTKTPIIVGILEASVYTALQLGPTFAIATTGLSWEPLFDEAVRSLGIQPSRYTGTRGSGFNAISLHGEGPFGSLVKASLELVAKGASIIVLGCAGMAPLRADMEAEISKQSGKPTIVVDCVQAGLESAISQARMRK